MFLLAGYNLFKSGEHLLIRVLPLLAKHLQRSHVHHTGDLTGERSSGPFNIYVKSLNLSATQMRNKRKLLKKIIIPYNNSSRHYIGDMTLRDELTCTPGFVRESLKK